MRAVCPLPSYRNGSLLEEETKRERLELGAMLRAKGIHRRVFHIEVHNRVVEYSHEIDGDRRGMQVAVLLLLLLSVQFVFRECAATYVDVEHRTKRYAEVFAYEMLVKYGECQARNLDTRELRLASLGQWGYVELAFGIPHEVAVARHAVVTPVESEAQRHPVLAVKIG